MAGKVIGKSMNYGFAGGFARTPDCIIAARVVKPDDTAPIAFGDPVILNADNTYSKFGADNTAAEFAGIAVKEVKTSLSYSNQSQVVYEPGNVADVIQRGNVTVTCNAGTPAAGGAVYIRITENAATPTGVVGGFEAGADGTNTIEITNAKWVTGKKDTDNLAELAILTRNLP